MKDPGLAVRRAYVPAASILLVLLVGNWLAESYAFDPLMAAQNQRIRFQRGGDLSDGASGLTPAEAHLAEAVLDLDRPIASERTPLLYVGNSQLAAIMDQQPGDLVTPQWLQILLARQYARSPRPIDVNLASYPNITATELLIELIAAGEHAPRRADVLLAAAVLEEFRGLGVRDEVAAALESPPAKAGLVTLLEANPDLPAARKALASFVDPATGPATASGNDASGNHIAAAFEQRTQTMAERAPLFAKRQNLQVALGLTYNALRDRLLGITSSSARPVPAAAFQATLELIELSLRYARSRDIHVVIYLAPMRLGVQPNPNLSSDVTRFRRDVPALCRKYGFTCLDYVDLIPEQLWTNYPETGGGRAQRDFAHFTGRAHKLLAERLALDAGSEFIRAAEEKRSLQP